MVGQKNNTVMWQGNDNATTAVPLTLAKARVMMKCSNKIIMKSNAAVDCPPGNSVITNLLSGNRIYRNRLLGVPPTSHTYLPAAAAAATAAAATATPVATAATTSATKGATYNSLPIHIRTCKLARKIMMSEKSTLVAKSYAGTVRESLAMEVKSLVTLIEDVEPACTQEAYEACKREVKRRKST